MDIVETITDNKKKLMMHRAKLLIKVSLILIVCFVLIYFIKESFGAGAFLAISISETLLTAGILLCMASKSSEEFLLMIGGVFVIILDLLVWIFFLFPNIKQEIVIVDILLTILVMVVKFVLLLVNLIYVILYCVTCEMLKKYPELLKKTNEYNEIVAEYNGLIIRIEKIISEINIKKLNNLKGKLKSVESVDEPKISESDSLISICKELSGTGFKLSLKKSYGDGKIKAMNDRITKIRTCKNLISEMEKTIKELNEKGEKFMGGGNYLSNSVIADTEKLEMLLKEI